MLIDNLDASLLYLAITLPFLVLWFVFFVFFSRIRWILSKTSLLFAFVGIFVENIFYIKDYWHPVSIYEFHIGPWIVYPEFILFGMVFAGVSSVIYQVAFKKQIIVGNVQDTVSYAQNILILVGIFLLVSFGLIFLGVNSIYATAVAALSMSAYMIFKRRDLFIPSILSAFLTVGVQFVFYFAVFFSIGNIEELMSDIWLLYRTGLDVRILGIPITELIWGFSAGSAIGIYYAFIRGYTFDPPHFFA